MPKRTKPKKPKVYDIPRHKLVAREILGTNGKPKSVGAAMRAVGYGKGYADNPHLLKKTLSFQALLKKYLPDDMLVEKHKELLHSGRLTTVTFDGDVDDKEIVRVISSVPGCFVIRIADVPATKHVAAKRVCQYLLPDHNTRRDVLELAYKVKGRMAPEVHEHFFEDMTTDQLVNFIVGKLAAKQ